MEKLSLIAFDLDGTVIDSVTRTFSPRVAAALEAAHEAGAITCVSTARSLELLGDEIASIEWIDLLSVSNGARVVDRATREDVICRPLGNARTLELMDALEPLDACWELYAREGSYLETRLVERVARRDDRSLPPDADVIRDVLRGMDEVESCRALVEQGLAHAIKVDCAFEAPAIADEAQRLLGAFDDLEVARMYDVSDFEITRAGVDKGSAIASLVERFGLDSGEVVAFGDSGNDLSMTGHAYRFVAVGNATPEIKAAADDICPPIDQDGVAVWLEEHLGL